MKILKNKHAPQWAVEYFAKYCQNNDNVREMENGGEQYTIECVRDIIYAIFEKFGKKPLTYERKEKIAWLVYCNYNHIKYCQFIDNNIKYLGKK